MISAIKTCLNKYSAFSGTASRPEFWYFYLAYILWNFLGGFISGFLGGGSGIIAAVFELSGLLPVIAVGVRRMHDVGKSGWFLLVPLYSLYLLLLPSISNSEN